MFAALSKPKFFALLTPLAPLLTATPSAAFLQQLLIFLTSLFPQAVLSDILSSPFRTFLESFFLPSASDSIFAAGCTLASVLDQSEWNLFETALGKHILESTGRNFASAEKDKETQEFGQVDKKKNSLALLAKLTKSGRLRKLVQKGGQAAAVWEKNVGDVCERVIAVWSTGFEKGQEVDEEQVSDSCSILRDSSAY